MKPTTPSQLAETLGCSERRIRSMARRLGACRIFGNTMVLLPEDVETILEYTKAEGPRPKNNPHDKRRDIAGVIYFVTCGERVKIGFTRNLSQRIRHLQTHCPDDIELVAALEGTRGDEAMLHSRFQEHRTNGEWFIYSDRIKKFIKEAEENGAWSVFPSDVS